MRGFSSSCQYVIVAIIVVAGCSTPQSQSVGVHIEANASQDGPSSVEVTDHPGPVKTKALWTHEGARIVGIAGNAAFYWDSDASNSGKIVALSLADGRRLSAREIPELNINGNPTHWLPGPGGFLAGWDEPMLIGENDGALSIRWKTAPGRWSEGMLAGDHVIYWQYRPDSVVTAHSPLNGREVWRSPLELEANGVELRTEGDRVYAIWQQYSPTAPTPTITTPQRVRAFDLATGQKIWTQDFREHTGGFALAGDNLVVAIDADLHFLDGRTRRTIKVVPTGHHPQIYPGFAVAGSTVYSALVDAVTAYDIATGAALWQHSVRLDGGPELVIAGELLLATTEHRSVVAIDRESGERRWEIMTDVSAYHLLVNERAVVVVGGNAAGIPLPFRLQPERATINGRVETRCRELADVNLWVGYQRLTPDANGNFSTTVEMAGELLVSDPRAHQHSPNYPHQFVVRFTGQGAYQVPTLTLDYCPIQLEDTEGR